MRLDKYLSQRLGIPRSESRRLAARGSVTVNGTVCKKGDTQLDEHTAAVCVDGQPLAGQYRQFVYLMLNKPAGVVSAARDARDTTVVDLAAGDYPRRQLFPAGRLDKTSTGFVLLTDDGALAHDILAPGRHVAKEYLVTLDTPLTPEMSAGFAAGVTLADGQTLAPALAEPPAATPAGCGWCCGRGCTTRSSGCSACTARASTRCTAPPSAGWRWTPPWPPATTGS